MSDIHFECPNCNQPIDASVELANQLVECSNCKETIEVPARTRKQPEPIRSVSQPAHQSNETVFFQSGNIMVTNARFVVGAQTFAMRGITSVEGVERPARYFWPLLLAFFGLVTAGNLFTGEIGAGIFGLLLMAIGIWLTTRRKATFSVVLRTAGGEVTAYQSPSRDHIAEIIGALNQAIISHA